MKSRGLILGRLTLARRGKPREGSKSGHCVECKEQIPQGLPHLILARSWKPKGKVLWYTRRFHIVCLPTWLKDAEKRLQVNEKKANANRTGRPKTDLDNISKEDLERRSAMQKRRSYLMNRLMRNPDYDGTSVREIEVEIDWLAKQVDAIAPSNRFFYDLYH